MYSVLTRKSNPPVQIIRRKPPRTVNPITFPDLPFRNQAPVRAKIMGTQKAPNPKRKIKNPAIWAPRSPNELWMVLGTVKKLFPKQGSEA
jgi:hypothetical protein